MALSDFLVNYRLIDTHTHVQFAAYDQDREAVIRRALEAGVGMVNVGTQYSTSADAIKLAGEYAEGVWATVGFHPGHADLDSHHDPLELREKKQETFEYEKFQELVRHPKVVAVGECGLDYYRMNSDQETANKIIELQRAIFTAQIKLAVEVKKPLVIHCRKAFPDLITLLTAHCSPFPKSAGVVHFFSGSWDDAQKLLDLGFYLGFGGVITFARDYDEVIQRAPLERIVVETDAPYVAPVPYRGKRNEPAYVVETVRKIAEIRGILYDEVIRATTKNAQELFRI